MKDKRFVFALFVLMMALALSGCGSNSGAKDAAPAAEEAVEETTEEAGAAAVDGLAIAVAELTEEPAFVDWEQDGVAMQLIALKSGSEVRLAYNTCQSCAGSPYAYFEYENGILTCQNCGNRFGLDSVGRVSGGCNPKPVGSYSEEGDRVVIPTEELASVAPAFRNWKAF